MDESCGFDCLGAEDELGFDYMSLLKGAGGMMSGAGGMFGGGGSDKGSGDKGGAAAEQAKAAQVAAESSARTWKIVGGITLAVLALVGIAVVARPKAAAATVVA